MITLMDAVAHMAKRTRLQARVMLSAKGHRALVNHPIVRFVAEVRVQQPALWKELENAWRDRSYAGYDTAVLPRLQPRVRGFSEQVG
jgi:hypothetical protein